MKKTNSKNYIILVILLIVTVFLTLTLVSVYKSKEKFASEFYNLSNKITVDELEEYIIENPDSIIYISDKYDLTKEDFEMKLNNKLKELNLEEKFVYIDTAEMTKEDSNVLEKKYRVNFKEEDTPIILVVIEKEIAKKIYVEDALNVDDFIDYEVFE